MRSTGNFSPEWGYLAPAPSFMRTARVVLVATAIGATAGAGVVLSLVDHPAADGEKTAIAPGNAATNVVAHTPAAQSKITKIPAAAPQPVTGAPPQIPAANNGRGA